MITRRLDLKSFVLVSLVLVAAVFGGWVLIERIWFTDVSGHLSSSWLGIGGIITSLFVVGWAAFVLRRRMSDTQTSEIKFQSLLEAAPDALVITGKKGIIALVNTQAERLFGYQREELLGKPLESLFSKQAQRAPAGPALSLYSTSQTEQMDESPGLIGRCKDGSEIIVEISSSPLKTEGSLLIIHIIRNVTERKIRERRRAARHAARRILVQATTLDQAAPGLLQALCEGLGWDLATLWIADGGTQELHCAGIGHTQLAPLATEFKRLSRESALGPGVGLPGRALSSGQPLWIGEIPASATDQRLALAAKDGLHTVLAFPLLLGSELLGAIELFSHEVRKDDEELFDALSSIGVQIGQFMKRKQAEDAVCESEARKTAILEAALDAIITIDHEGNIREFNPAAERIFGHRRADVIGQEMAKRLLPASLHDWYRQGSAKYCSCGEGLDLGKRQELTALRADGSDFPVELTITRIRTNGPLMFTCYIRDISARKQAEETLRQTEERYRQSQKMEAIGRLAGGIAHDFNNILTVITGCGALLLRDLQPDNPAREYTEIIMKAGERAAMLVRQILAFSRKQVLAPKVFDLNAAVTDMNRMLNRVIGEDISLATVLTPTPQPVKADPGQIEQVIMNLAVNARDAMPGGGKLTLETAEVELDENYARAYPEVQPGPYVMLAVSDTGCGMGKEVQARLFEPFFTTKEQGKGTGLGLATIYGIVKQSGGHIAVYSEPGQGSTFKIYLPCVTEAISAPEPCPAPAETLCGTGTVLLVEDEDEVRMLSRQFLQMNGYNVLEARHASEALQLWEKQDAPIDIMVTDVIMPEMNGCELAERIQARQPDLKVLYVSGYTESAILRQDLLDKSAAFLQKPFTPHSLATKVRELLCA